MRDTASTDAHGSRPARSDGLRRIERDMVLSSPRKLSAKLPSSSAYTRVVFACVAQAAGCK